MSLCEKHDEITYCEECGKTCVGCILDPYIEEVQELKAKLEAIERKAEAGLCYFTLESARSFLTEIQSLAAKR